MDHNVDDTSEECREDVSSGNHSIEQNWHGNCSEKPKLENRACAFCCLISSWEVVSHFLFQVFIEWIFWWPCFIAALIVSFFFDFVLSKNIPNFVAERMILFYKSCTFSTSAEWYRMSASWMLSNKVGQIEFLSMNDPMVWIDFGGVWWISATKSVVWVGRDVGVFRLWVPWSGTSDFLDFF